MNVSRRCAILCATAIVLSTAPRALPAELEIGVAVADITPPAGYRMSGYFSERPSSGTHDSLQARALVLRQGKTQAALVCCDLIGISLDASRKARAEAARRTGIPASNILIAATHSHTGPLYFGALREHFHARAVAASGEDPHEKVDYPELLVSRLAGAIAAARKSLAPAELRAGTTRQEGLSFNRRYHMKNGTVRFNPGKQNPDIVRAAGPVDPEVGVLLVRDPASGKARAALTVFALHLDTVGGELYSADFPLYLERTLRSSLGEDFVSMFGNGTCGDINHIDVSNTEPQKGQEEARRIGDTLGATVSKALDGLSAVDDPTLAVRSATIAVPLQEFSEIERDEAQRNIEKVGSSELPFLEQVRAYKVLAVGLRRRKAETIPLEAQVFRLSEKVAIVGLPGEIFVELGLAIKKASPFETTIVVELANDAPGYIPTEKAFREGSYETVNSRVKPGGGERLVDAAVGLLKELAPTRTSLPEIPQETAAETARRHQRVAERRERTQLFCHRGALEFAHENTLEAYRATFSLGGDGNEIDIRSTRDGVLVCFHDDMLDSLLAAHGDASDYTWDELKRFRFRSPGPFGPHCRIPTLVETLQLHRVHAGLLHLDVKRPGLDTAIAQLLDRMDMWDHVVHVNRANADAILKGSRLKLGRYKASGMYLDRSEVDPEAIAAALQKPGDSLILEDPRAVAVALGRKFSRPPEEPVAPVPSAEPAPGGEEAPPLSQLLAVLRDADDASRIAETPEERERSAQRILARARAAELLAKRAAIPAEALALLRERVRNRSLHPEWMYHGLDGAAALRVLIDAGDAEAVPLARFALWRDDPALEPIVDPRWNNPRSWTDFRVKFVTFRALERLAGPATWKLCRDYLALSDEEARRIGPPQFEAAARTLLATDPREETALELLRHRRSDVRGRAILACVAAGRERWAREVLARAAPHALSYIVSRSLPIFDRRTDAAGKPIYRIYPLRNGVCSVKGPHAFMDNDEDSKSYPYALYIWLVLGGEKPILIDAGLEDVAHMNEGAAKVFDEPITQDENETTAAQLRKFGLTHADIGHVFVTHLHFDHVDEIFKYKNAGFHIGKKEWEGVTANGTRGSWCDGRVLFKLMRPEWRRKMHLIEDEEVLPGFESFWVGGHTRGSMAYRINTEHGKVVCTGDTISLLSNMDRPVGVFWNADEVRAAMRTIREKADIVLPSHDPGTLDRWPPPPKGTAKGAADNTPKYTIRAVRVGECQVTNEITFQDAWGDNRGTRKYLLYVWVIEGGEKPIVVDTGPNPLYVDEFNRSTAQYIIGGLKQTPEEDTKIALKRAGIDPADVSHVVATHCHADHYDYISAFPNARFVVNKTEFENRRTSFPAAVVRTIYSRPDVVMTVEDEEILPGIRTVQLGCHTEGSQGVLVQTHMGPVLLTGDVVYTYQNIEEDRPGRSPSPDNCKEAMAKIRRLADIVLPSHDPRTLERWPGGVIGGRPGRGVRAASGGE